MELLRINKEISVIFPRMHSQSFLTARSYKYDVVTCPYPDALMTSSLTNMKYDTCREDNDCTGEQVCCSNGYARVCADPVGKIYFNTTP